MNSSAIPFENILNVKFHSLSLRQVLDTIDVFIQQRTPRQISFSNAQTLVMCHFDKGLAQVINSSDLTLADGMSILWGARILGLKLPERVAGPDLMHALAGRAMEKKYSIFLLGSSPSNLENLKKVLESDWPGINIVGLHSPSVCERMGDEENRTIIQLIKQYNPDILFVGLSCPKQEKWIRENIDRLNVPVSLGVGAAFDFISKRIPRAPEWFRQRGLEWLHRLYCEPRRLWRRYLVGNSIFIFLLFIEKFKRKIYGEV